MLGPCPARHLSVAMRLLWLLVPLASVSEASLVVADLDISQFVSVRLGDAMHCTALQALHAETRSRLSRPGLHGLGRLR